MAHTDQWHGIIAQFERFREERTYINEVWDEEEGKFVELTEEIVDYPGVVFEDYEVHTQGHPNALIYNALQEYIVCNTYRPHKYFFEDLEDSIMSILRTAYHYAHLMSLTHNPSQDLINFQNFCREKHKDGGYRETLIASIILLLLKKDSSLKSTPELGQIIHLAEMCYSNPLGKVPYPFYPYLLKSVERKAEDATDSTTCTAPSATPVVKRAGRKTSPLFLNNEDEQLWSERFVAFLAKHNRSSAKITSSAKDFTLRHLVCFLREWQSMGLLPAGNPNFAAAYRFIETCQLDINGVDSTTLKNKIGVLYRGKSDDEDTIRVEDFIREIEQK